MRVLNQLGKFLTALAIIGAMVVPAEARTRKGEKLLKEGRVAEAKRDFERALELYEQAVAEDPTDAAYQLGVRRVRFQAGQARVEQGFRLREAGKLEEAAAEFQKGFTIDPSSQIAVTELKRTLGMIEAAKRKADGKPAGQAKAPPDAGQETEARLNALLPAPELKPMSRRITTLKMNNQPVKILFETLGKLAGINVVWDPEYQSASKNYSVDLSNTTLDQALEHLSVLTKTYWKPISANSIFLTNDNVTKRRDHQDMVVKTFYLKNLTTPQELQEIATILRAVTDIRRVFTYNAQNIIMVRGEIDKVLLAEKLVADLDKAKGEVVIDVFVMEANRSRTRDLAATFLSGGLNGLKLPISFTPRAGLGLGTGTGTGTGSGSGSGSGSGTGTGTGTGTVGTGTDTTAASGAVRLTRLGDIRLDDFAMAIPNAMLQALMTDRGTRVMQAPQVRAIHGIKSSLKIGDRYPYATGSFQPGVGAVGVSPLVSTQFQFADVGVNVDITPNIHGSDEVTMKVEVDITNIRDRIDVGGLSQPVIGQRKFTQDIRLRTGEVSIVGGLTQDQDTRGISGTPGLANIPLVRRLFSGESIEKSQGELLIALVPHIVRIPDINDMNLRGIFAGTDTDVTLKRNPIMDDDSGADEKPALAPSTAPLPIPGAPGQQPAVPVGAPMPVKPPADPGPAAAGSSTIPKLTMSASTRLAPVNSQVQVTVSLENVKNLVSAPIRLRWDPKVLRLSDIARGGMISESPDSPFSKDIRNDEGQATVQLARPPAASGVSGSGALMNLVFEAIGPGSAAVEFVSANLTDSENKPIPAALEGVVVNVRTQDQQ